MNKKLILILMAAFLLSLASFGLADADPEVTQADFNDTVIFGNPQGVEVRFLELEQQITKNVENGLDIIEVIELNHSNFNTSRLYEIIDELELLLDEIQSLNLSDNMTDFTEDFLIIKAESRALIKEFRTTVHVVLDVQEVPAVKEQIQSQEHERVQAIESQIKKAKHEYNAQRLRTYLNLFGEQDEALVSRVRMGQSSKDEIVEYTSEVYSLLDSEEKATVSQKMTEQSLKAQIHSKASMTQIRSNMNSTFEQRKEERNTHMGNKENSNPNAGSNINKGGNDATGGSDKSGSNSNTNSGGNTNTGGNGGSSSTGGSSDGGTSGGNGGGNGGGSK